MIGPMFLVDHFAWKDVVSRLDLDLEDQDSARIIKDVRKQNCIS